MANLIFILILSLGILFGQILSATIDDQIVTNERGEVEFRVLDENKIKIANRHQTLQPSLKFSLHGGKVEKISKQNSASWNLTLTDGSVIGLSSFEASKDVTGYYVHWHGATGSSQNRELCFHYSYNDAYW